MGDRDPLGVQFVPQSIRQGFHGMLAHGIHPGGGHRDEGIDRAHDGQTTFGGNEVVGCGSYGSNDPHDIHFELSANFVFRKLIHPSLGGISSIGHHHVNAAEGLPGRSRQGFHIVGLHHITSLHEASDSAGLFDFLGKLSEPIDPSCPENEVVVPLCEDTSQSFSDAGRGAGDQGNGAVGWGMGFGLHMHSVRSRRQVGGNQMAALPAPFLASFLALRAGPVCLLVKQSSFRGKEVLLPSDHGHGLAHQESSPTVQESSFQDPLLTKGRQR